MTSLDRPSLIFQSYSYIYGVAAANDAGDDAIGLFIGIWSLTHFISSPIQMVIGYTLVHYFNIITINSKRDIDYFGTGMITTFIGSFVIIVILVGLYHLFHICCDDFTKIDYKETYEPEEKEV